MKSRIHLQPWYPSSHGTEIGEPCETDDTPLDFHGQRSTASTGASGVRTHGPGDWMQKTLQKPSKTLCLIAFASCRFDSWKKIHHKNQEHSSCRDHPARKIFKILRVISMCCVSGPVHSGLRTPAYCAVCGDFSCARRSCCSRLLCNRISCCRNHMKSPCVTM